MTFLISRAGERLFVTGEKKGSGNIEVVQRENLLPEVLTFSFVARMALASFSNWVAMVINWWLSMEHACSKRSEHLQLANESADTMTFTSLLALVSISCPYSMYLSDIPLTFFFCSSPSPSSDHHSSSSRMTSAPWKAWSRSVWIDTWECKKLDWLYFPSDIVTKKVCRIKAEYLMEQRECQVLCLHPQPPQSLLIPLQVQ